jgi:hypothetical protein
MSVFSVAVLFGFVMVFVAVVVMFVVAMLFVFVIVVVVMTVFFKESALPEFKERGLFFFKKRHC